MLDGYEGDSLAMTAFYTKDGAILMRKSSGCPTTPMPSTEQTAGADMGCTQGNSGLMRLPVSLSCGDVVQVALKSGAVCVPTNPMSLTRVGLSAPFGCSMASTGSKVCPPRTHAGSQPGKGNQVVRWQGVGLP